MCTCTPLHVYTFGWKPEADDSSPCRLFSALLSQWQGHSLNLKLDTWLAGCTSEGQQSACLWSLSSEVTDTCTQLLCECWGSSANALLLSHFLRWEIMVREVQMHLRSEGLICEWIHLELLYIPNVVKIGAQLPSNRLRTFTLTHSWTKLSNTNLRHNKAWNSTDILKFCAEMKINSCVVDFYSRLVYFIPDFPCVTTTLAGYVGHAWNPSTW